ncbi:metallophosphoesterase [Paraburkholderia bryophila]|uniref:Putative phosphodiesterase n=1 Tax=Paraburkholderia bryophila TaxID=420952 RepID=A0A7Y9WDC7_9BURK|nr:metallophosphoesterase [Paraburkholderia bryophila]NYH18779.1 putative phosphodiesterase [Paraburkholderia bryophila]
MRIQLASDLHLEFLSRQFPGERLIAPAPAADVLVLAGDIGLGSTAVELFKDWPVPVLYIAGNHECYHECWEAILEELADRAKGTSVRFLEREIADFGGVRFLGCTLWTDYCLRGTRIQSQAMDNAQRCLHDHRVIRTRDGERFLPADALRDHERSRAWLSEELGRAYDGKTVVVTHHGPHPLSVHPMYAGDITSAAFVGDLTELVQKADLWFHGHCHSSFDYQVGACRVVTNPRGYPLNRYSVTRVKELEFENPEFQYACVIDTAA